MRLVICAGLVLAASSFAQDQSHLPNSQQAYTEFVATTPGQWIAQWHPATHTPSAIYGTGITLPNWTENSLEHARVHANQALRDYRELLGLGTSDWQESIGARMGRTWSFKFDQHFQNLPVIGGRADVRINMAGVIAMLGSVAFPIPANFNTTPAIGHDVATAIAWQQVGEPTGQKQPGQQRLPQLVIWGDTETSNEGAPTFALAWEIPISNVDRSGQGPIGRYYIDAQGGGVLHYRTDKHECGSAFCMDAHHGSNRTEAVGPLAPLPTPVPTTVTVMAWTRVGIDAAATLSNVPLAGVVLNVPGIGLRTTDSNGQFSIDIVAPVTITASVLDGTHYQPMVGPNGPVISGTVNPGVATTIQIGSAASNEFQAAHTTAAYYVHESNEWIRSILDMNLASNITAMNTASNINSEVNITATCNAYYTGNSINFYTSGGGCANTAFSTVIAHEWGHGLDDRFGGISNSIAEGVSEGWGDILGMYLLDTPLLGSGFQTPGVALRNGNNTRIYPYSSTSPHGAGQVWMGFAWRLRDFLRTAYGTTTAIQITEDIVVGSIVADATTRIDAVREVFIADDNDGNLLNGTPNYIQLEAAALAKGIPYPVVQLASITHTPLANTTERVSPRHVTCVAAPTGSGAITAVTLHYSVNNGPTQIRTMHPNGQTNGYEAMLPGLVNNGSVAYRIEAVHNGTFTVRSPATGNYAYTVDDATFWSDNFDGTPQGWTHALVATQDDWQVGDPFGRTGTSSGVAWADPQNAASGTNCWGNDLGGTGFNGSYQPSVYNYLRSPVINCTGRTGVTLSFSRWLTVEEALYDQATLLVNGVQVWRNAQTGNHLDTAWQSVTYPIPMADNNPNVVIEFRLQTDAGLNLGGWNIDDVRLSEAVIVPLDATLQLLPEQSAQSGAMNLSVTTSGAARPFVVAIGGTAGPTLFPNIPPIFVGGNLVNLPGWTDATGNFSLAFNAPAVASTIGTTWFSQAVTLDPTNTMIITSNRFRNLFTMTP